MSIANFSSRSSDSKTDYQTLCALTEKEVRDILFGKIYDRAEAYYRGGRVSNPRRVGAKLLAEVQGTELYEVMVRVDQGLLWASCTCPFAATTTCKHMGALLLQWVRDRESFAVIEEEQEEKLAGGQAAPSYFPGPTGESSGAYRVMDAAVPRKGEWLSLAIGTGDVEFPETDSEEEQSGLITLLQQIPLAELREIARQRGWRVKGTSKAEYVPALASLLRDPTETARAVTGLPENLREGLRAAFVADDGSGITATIMAQTMTALRGVAGPAVKPVEAAALLSDLARWGLVLQWRDSLYGEGRYVLPWEVQRLVPPLPGWCPSHPEIAPASTSATDAQRAVRTLCAIWEGIAAEQPAVRPPATLQGDGAPFERLAERRFSSMVQGWPYDPEELRQWAANRRRTDTAMQTISVPPTPYLVEDAALSALARLIESSACTLPRGHEEQLEFLCRMLCELDLVSIRDGHLVTHKEEMARFLQLSVPDQHRAMAQAYMSLLDWSELDLLLRQDTRLILWRKPYFTMPYDQFRSLLVRLRHLLLRFLACAGEDGWFKLSNVEVALRKLWPQFSTLLQGERQAWLSQAWGLAWRQESHESHPNEDGRSNVARRPEAGHAVGEMTAVPPLPSGGPVDWGASQGAFLRVMLEGPLCWLGFAELSHSDGQLVAFRLHGLANWIWDRPTPRFVMEGKAAGEALTIDEAAGTIALAPGSVPPEAHTFLRRIARLEEASPEGFLYRLHPQAALAAFESGQSLSDLLTEWERVMSQPMPTALRETLSQFWTRYGQVRLYEGFGLLELNDEVTLQELEAGTSLSQHIVARLSPRLVLVPDEAVEELMREFAAKDYTPRQVQ